MLSHEQHKLHSCPQKPRSFWSVREIATSGLVQRHSDFEWLCKHNRLRPEPIRFARLDCEHAQGDVKSVNSGLSVLGLARGRHSCLVSIGCGSSSMHLPAFFVLYWVQLPFISKERGVFLCAVQTGHAHSRHFFSLWMCPIFNDERQSSVIVFRSGDL